jgi:subtilase family serine protease
MRYPYLALVACAALLALVASVTFHNTSIYAAPSSGRHTLPGHIAPELKQYKSTHATSKSNQLQLSISLNLRNRAALDALIVAQNDPNSLSYHQYLTPSEFTAEFGPTQATVDSVVSYLKGQGLQVKSVAPNNLLVDASGSVATVEQAFGVTLNDYVINGRTVYSPSADPTVPDALGAVILNVGGLDNVAKYRHSDVTRQAQPATGPGGGYTPTELRTAYDENSLISAGGTGTGQTTAIFELDGYKAADVTTYLSNYGLGASRFSNVLVDGATNAAGAGAIEVELDMEVVSAIAPNATQKIYIGPNTNAGVNDTYNRIVTDNTAKVTSISWGECESASGSSSLTTLDNIFAQGAAQGQAFFAASGDSGAYDCGNGSTTLAVDSPADDPHVVGVGGTRLTVGSGGTYSSESAWGVSNQGGGGGISTFFTRPSYQTGTNLTNTHREVPDVSADADPASGYSVYCTVTAAQCSSSNGWISVGGTSAAAPLWAATATDLNSYLAAQSKPVLGSASASLYTLYNTAQTYSAYHDVTTGNNLYYTATAGYDNASGVGTPDAWNIARDLAGSTTPPPTPTPTPPPTGTPTPTPPPTPTPTPPIGSTSQLLLNPGFESGASSWTESSTGGYEIVDPTRPHTGADSAYLGGYNSGTDSIYQTVALPASTSKVVLTYWVYISTQETSTTAYDTFVARLRTSSGTTISTPQTLSNKNASGWTQYSFDVTSVLASHVGQSIEVYFSGTTDSTLTTSFFVDDVALNVTH